MKLLPVRSPAATTANLSSIKCVIVYEDFESGLRAKRLAEILAEELDADCDCRSLWRSELIELPEIGDHVAGEAFGSDFVILALRGDRNLSYSFKRWIENWLALAPAATSSLVALFDRNRSAAAPAAAIRCYLRDLSAAAGIGFFACCPPARERSNPDQTWTAAVRGLGGAQERGAGQRTTVPRTSTRMPVFSRRLSRSWE